MSNIVDHGLTIQQALEAGRFTKGTFEGCDVDIEALVPEATRAALTARGHVLEVAAPRSGGFGFGQAVMNGPGGVHFGASEPRHDGAAIPQAPAVFDGPRPRVAVATNRRRVGRRGFLKGRRWVPRARDPDSRRAPVAPSKPPRLGPLRHRRRQNGSRCSTPIGPARTTWSTC